MTTAVLARRIYGVETEYGITCTNPDGTRCLGAGEIARAMFKPIVAQWGSSNIFIPNGSRLYLDVGSHPEYASVECDSLSQLIAYDKAGDRIVHQLAHTAQEQVANAQGGSVYLFKNNLDSAGNSYGCHENYLISRDIVLKSFGRQLLPFLITRQLIAGAGCIKQGIFHISQRAEHVWEGVSSATTRSRPIINTRDEPHADSKRYRRLHVIVGDSNMAEPTMALKIGSMQLVLEMLEAGLLNLEMNSDISAIRDISKDLSGNTPVELSNHEPMTALEIQRYYANAARQWLKQRPNAGTPTAELEKVVELWHSCLDALANGDIEALAPYVDWAAKLRLMRGYQQRLGLAPTDFEHPKLAQLDLAYHDINPKRGLFYALQRRGLVQRWIDDAAIEQAINQPPQSTRGKLRGETVALGRSLQAPVVCDWLRIKVSRPEPQIVELSDPFTTEDPAISELHSYMQEHRQYYAEQG